MGFALSSSSPALSLSTATLTQTDNSRVKREGVGPLNALPAFTHSPSPIPVPGDAVNLVGLRMQADVPGVHTLYDAVNLANNADGSAGDTALVGSMQVARHADGDRRHDDAQRAGERIGPAAAFGAGGHLTASTRPRRS